MVGRKGYNREIVEKALELVEKYKPATVRDMLNDMYGVDIHRNTLLYWRQDERIVKRKPMKKMTMCFKCPYCDRNMGVEIKSDLPCTVTIKGEEDN